MSNPRTGGKGGRPEISRRQLLKMASPLGRVTMEKAGCTGCGLCALDCPTGALTVSSDEKMGTRQLLFKHGLCVACGQCVEVCPERCLHLERTLELDGLNLPAVVLFEDEIVRCAGCGLPFTSRAMLDSITAKLPAAGDPLRLELCSECKARATLSGLVK